MSRGEKRCAVRVSEFESIETALALRGRCNWVWLDCFSRFPIDATGVRRLRDAGFKVCLVSPDLLGRGEEVVELSNYLRSEAIEIDAVCSKFVSAWVPVG